MTNNLDDFEQPDLEHGNGQPPQQPGLRGNLTNAWRTRPLFKLLVIMVVVVAVTAIAVSLFSNPKPAEVTRLAAPPAGFKQAPGGASTPYFIEQTKKAEAERQNTAIRTGGDALPTPIGANTSIDEMTAEKQKKDPLVELRAQIEQQKQKIAQIEQQKQPAQQQKEQFDDSLAQAMQKQLQQLQAGWDARGIRQVNGAPEPEDKNKIGAQNGQGTNGMGSVNGAGSDMAGMSGMGGKEKFAQPIINAGTVSYSQLLTEANSDAPGPILAQILSGPLKGARAIGEFKVEHDFLVLKFNLANLKGIDYRISAYALDPDTTLPAMATEVDQRYFTRVLLPAAAGFMQGFGQALGQNSSSIATNGQTTIVQQSGKGLEQGLFTGIGQVGQTLSQFFQNQANETKPLVRVAAGTPMGLFFTQTVCNGQGCPLDEGTSDRGRQQNYGNVSQQGGYPQNQQLNGYGYNPVMQGGMYNGATNNAPYVPLQGYSGAESAQNSQSSTNGGSNPYSNSSGPYNNNSSNLGYQSNGYNSLGSPGIGMPVVNP